MPSWSLFFLLVEETLALPPLERRREDRKFIVIATGRAVLLGVRWRIKRPLTRCQALYTHTQGGFPPLQAPLGQRHP